VSSELWKFLKSPVFYFPAGLVLALELFLQSGLYNAVLKPESFAFNVNRIRSVVKQTSYRPNVLIIGTSVAYQGLLIPDLNQAARDSGLRFQSAATQAAMIETQHALLRDLAPSLPGLRWIIHVAEIDFPYQARHELESANRSMLAQFPREETLQLLKEHRFRLTPRDYAFFYLRTLTYQSDLRDFLLNPPRRFKSLARQRKKEIPDVVYLNQNRYAISAYGSNPEECEKNAIRGIPFFDDSGRQVTDEPHRTAVLDTCRNAGEDLRAKPGGNTWRTLFFHRLKKLHEEARKHNLRLVTVFAPYSEMMAPAHDPERIRVWQEEFAKAGYYSDIIDLRYTLDGPDNLSLFYDTIHLNRQGAERFTGIFYRRVEEFLRREDPGLFQKTSGE
jgi:hypothetical protein